MHTDVPSKQARKCYDKGLELYNKGEVQKALPHFEEAVELSPGWATAYYYRGLALCCLGRYSVGIEDFERVIEMDPKNVDARYYKGVACELDSQPELATIAYAEALRLDPSRTTIKERLAGIWSSKPAEPEKPTRETVTKPLSSYDSDRRQIDIAFEENDMEQSKPLLRERPAEVKDLSVIALPAEAKTYVSKVTRIIKNQKLARQCGLRKSSGVILEGPNGTGKTELAYALAGELGWNIVTASFGNFASKWLGQTESNLVKIFDTLKSEGCLPAVILFDEIDSIVRSKDGESRSYECSVVNTFITEINRISNDSGLKDVFIVGTTNHINLIDPSIIRSGRLDRVAMPLPTLEAREEIFKIHFKGKPVAKDVDFKVLAFKTEGRSGADIASYANEASYQLFEARLKNRRTKEISMDIIEDIIKKPAGPKHVPGYA